MPTTKSLALSVGKALGAFSGYEAVRPPQIPILCYHGLWNVADGFAGDAMFMLAETFPERLDHLTRLGYTVVSLDDAIAIVRGDEPPREKTVAITIDDGWASTASIMAPALRARGMPATLYCDTAQLERGGPVPHVMARYLRQVHTPGALDPEAARHFAAATDLSQSHEVRLDSMERFASAASIDLTPYKNGRTFEYMSEAELADFYQQGFQLGLHTHNHSLHDLSAERVSAELGENIASLTRILGTPASQPWHFCYPSGVHDEALSDWLMDNGYLSATTTQAGIAKPGMHRGRLPRIIDGNQFSDVEFEAELLGIAEAARKALGRHEMHGH